jgi:hypothetical protein
MNSGVDGLLTVLLSYPMLIASVIIAAVSFALLITKRKTLKRGTKIALAAVGSVALCIVLALAVFAFAFGGNLHPAAPPSQPDTSLEIYLVSGELPDDESKIDLDELTLSETPVVTLSDIQKYYWDKQAFVMKKGLLAERLNAGDTSRSPAPVWGSPYVLVVNGERIYMGKFWTLLSSSFPYNPRIVVDGTMGVNDGSFDLQPDQQLYAVQWSYAEGDTAEKERIEAIVFDKRIHDALQAAGLLEE